MTCTNCEKNPTRGRKVLCHSCEREERGREVQKLDMHTSREFKMDARRLEAEALALEEVN